MLAAWPELAELRRCSPRGTAAHRWSQALSGLTAGARAALDGALLAQRARRPGIPLGEEVNLATMVLQGTACYEGVSLLLQGGLRAMAAPWRSDQERVEDAEARLSHIAGSSVGRSSLRGAGSRWKGARSPSRWLSCCSELHCAPGGPGLWP